MFEQISKFALLAVLGAAVVGCVPEVKENNTSEQAIEKRSNPPYFPIGDNCVLPKISPEVEVFQTEVMERLAAGIKRSSLEPVVFETGVGMVMMCPSRGDHILKADQIPLYLTYRHLEPVKKSSVKMNDFCAGGDIYTGIASSLSPERLYGETRLKVQCVALLPETVLTYGVQVCVQGSKITDLDIRDVKEPIFYYDGVVEDPLPKSSLYCD